MWIMNHALPAGRWSWLRGKAGSELGSVAEVEWELQVEALSAVVVLNEAV